MTLYTYNQFRSFASSRIDLYAFNNPCSERSTLTFVISVVGGFVIRESIFAASVSRIILAVNLFSLLKEIPIITDLVNAKSNEIVVL